MDENEFELNATRQILAKIGDPNGGFPKTPKKNVSPRVGFAYDLSGTAVACCVAATGVYFDHVQHRGVGRGTSPRRASGPSTRWRRWLNTAIGVGALANYRFGLDPLPPQPTEGNKLPANATGQWISPDNKSGRTYQTHVGYAHTLAANTTVSVDFTLSEGRNELRIINITRSSTARARLAPALVAHGLPANSLGNVNILSSINKFALRRADVALPAPFAASHAAGALHLAHAYAYGGSTGNRSGRSQPMVWDQPFGPGEWGPNRRRRAASRGGDRRLRLATASSSRRSCSLPARGHTTCWRAPTSTGRQQRHQWGDRYSRSRDGQQVSLNSARGDNTFVFDMRSTKFFNLGSRQEDRRRSSKFFNLFNTANFGAQYTGNGRQ
jgi:hypothetical protein